MAYVGNQLSIVSGTIEGSWNTFFLSGTDSLATVLAANYISDGQKRGMETGDVVWYFNGTTLFLLQVVAMQVTTSGYGVTMAEVASGTGTGVAVSNTAITTVGAGVLTAAGIVGGLITRTGSTAAYTDTTDTAAAIIADMNAQIIGNSWSFVLVNDTAFAETLAAGTGVTLSGISVLPANSWAEFLVTYSATGAVTMYGIKAGANTALPAAKYTTSSVTTGSIAAGVITGANFSVWLQTGATPGAQLVRTAAQMLADIPGAQVGDSFLFRILNTGAGTLTLTTDAGATVTMTGTMTIAQNTFRDFILTFNTATTATVQDIGTGTAP